MIGRPSPASRSRGNCLLGTSAKMPASWASLELADLGAEEDFGRPLRRAKALVAVDQPGQFGRQPPLGQPPARIAPGARPAALDLVLPRSVKNRRQRPTSASSRLIQYW